MAKKMRPEVTQPQTRRVLLKYRGDKCCCCHKTIPEHIRRFGGDGSPFQFNHVVPSEKAPNYDNLRRRKLSSEVLDEHDKCHVLCSFCHDILHEQNANGMMTALRRLEGQTVMISAPFQAIFEWSPEAEISHIHLISDPQIGFNIYQVVLGSEEPRWMSTVELRRKLLELLGVTRAGVALRICDERGRSVFDAWRISETEVRVDWRIELAVMEAQFRTEDWGQCFSRSGKTIDGHGEIHTGTRLKITLHIPESV